MKSEATLITIWTEPHFPYQQRERLQASTKTCRALAEEMAISVGTVHRWRNRTSPEDNSCRPHDVQYAFDEAEQALILSLRQKGLPLDDLVDLLLQPLPEAKRSSVYRLLDRNGVSRLPKKGEQPTGQEDKHGQFKDYGPGFVHIDCFIRTVFTCPNLKAKSVTASWPLIAPLACRFFGCMKARTRRRRQIS